MWAVMYRTADNVSRVRNGLAGSFMYFAEAQPACDTGLYVEKLVLNTDETHDFLGNRFKEASPMAFTRFARY